MAKGKNQWDCRPNSDGLRAVLGGRGLWPKVEEQPRPSRVLPRNLQDALYGTTCGPINFTVTVDINATGIHSSTVHRCTHTLQSPCSPRCGRLRVRRQHKIFCCTRQRRGPRGCLSSSWRLPAKLTKEISKNVRLYLFLLPFIAAI
jgi:hypothetical protein